MNKNNGLLMGIAGLIVVAAGIIIIVLLTKNTPPETVPETVPVVAVTTPVVVTPSEEEPVVDSKPIVTPPAAMPIIKAPIKKPVATVTGSAPEVTTLGTSSLSSGGVVLNGLLNTHNAETYFSFQYGTSPSFGLVTRFAPIDGSNSAVNVTLAAADLYASTTYYYRLNAQNEFGKVQGETKSFVTLASNGSVVYNPNQATTNNDPLAPGVTTQEVSSISQNEAVFNGLLITHNVETYFSFKYGTTPSLGMETRVAPIAGSSNLSNVTLAVFNLMPHTVYYYQLHAHNQYGITADGINQFTTAQ